MAVEEKANAMQDEQNLERPVSSEGMLKSFAMTRSFKNTPLRRFHQTLKTKTSRVKTQVDRRIFRSNALSGALRQFSRRTFSNRTSMTLTQAGGTQPKGRKWSALAMTLPTGSAEGQAIQPTTGSISSRTFTSGQAIPAFSLPDDTPLFRQATTETERTASKPKWKPPEPGARRFSRIEEIQPSMPAEAPTAFGSTTPAETTLQRSPKAVSQVKAPSPVSPQPTAVTKPQEPAVRQNAASTPAIKTPERQKISSEIPSPQSRPSQSASSQDFAPASQKVSTPGRPVGLPLPDQAAVGLPTPPAPIKSQLAVEPKAEPQKTAPGPTLAATPTLRSSSPTPQAPAAEKDLPHKPAQELPQPVQMPLTARRVLPTSRKTRQTQLSQRSIRPSRPQPVLPKVAQPQIVQRKTTQIPLKRRTAPQKPQVTTSPREADTIAPSISQSPLQPQKVEPVPAKPQAEPGPAFTSPAVPQAESPQAERPSPQATNKNMPLQRKNPQLPLKKPVLSAPKPLTSQTRGPNAAVMPIRRKPATPRAATQVSAEIQTPKPRITLRALATSPGSAPATPGQALPTNFPELTQKAPSSKAEFSSLPAETPKPKLKAVDAPSSTSAENPEAAPSPALPPSNLPLLNQTILHRASSRKQLLRSRQLTYAQRQPGRLTTAKPTLTRISHLPVQSIQRSPRQGYAVIPTRIIPVSTHIPTESPAGTQPKSPLASPARPRFEESQAAVKAQQARPSSVGKASPRPQPQPTIKKEVQATKLTQPTTQRQAQATKIAPLPAQKARQKTISPIVLPPSIGKQKVLSLSALRKGKPVLAGQTEKPTVPPSKPVEQKHQPKREAQAASNGVSPKKPATPIHSLKSSPVVQRKPVEGEGWMYQTERQDLPLASQTSSSQSEPTSQIQSDRSGSNRHHAPGQAMPPLGQPPSSREDGLSSSTQRRQQSPPEPPLPPGYSSPFSDEPPLEMPLRTPNRPNTFEDESQPEPDSTAPSAFMRDESHVDGSEGTQATPTEAQRRANLQELARKVYPEIIRMLNVETEWFSRRF